MSDPTAYVPSPGILATDEHARSEGCRFDPASADGAVEFIEGHCYLSSGVSAGSRFFLLPWQRDFVRRLFGWRRADGSRRYRSSHLSTAKKNGATSLVLATAVALTREYSSPPASVRLQATRAGSAELLQGMVSEMYRSTDLGRSVRVHKGRRRFLDGVSGGVLTVCSTFPGGLDGRRDSAVLVHGLDGLSDGPIWESCRGLGMRPGGLTITAGGVGLDRGPWYQERRRAWAVNSGELLDSSHLAMVFEADPGDDPGSPDTWRKANPSLGATVSPDSIRDAFERSRRVLGELGPFRRFHLNQLAA